MTRLPELQRELVAAAARQEAAAGAGARRRSQRGRRPTARVLALTVLTLLALAAIGAAATGLLGAGEDVQPRSGKAPTPKTGFGVPTGAVADPIVVEDPAGGALKWGLRTFTTTRGYACVQLGRVQDGELGLVGRDGAFEDDGLFHALGPQVLEAPGCVPVDARGQGFVAIHDAEMPAGGMHSCLPPSMITAFGGRIPKGGRACSASGMRSVDYGLLGPRAESIAYTLPSGEPRTAAAAPGTGAFLIVTARERLASTQLPGQVSEGAYLIARTPAAARIKTITYDDGTTCQVKHTYNTRAGGCPAKGHVPLNVALPSRAAVRTPMTARIAPNDEGSFTLHVAFRARVAAETARAAYVVMIRPTRSARCHQGLTGHTLERDVAAGQRVGAAIKLSRISCSGRYRIDLDYRVVSATPQVGTGLAYPGVAVGSARAELVK